jgi:hypothetical protein
MASAMSFSSVPASPSAPTFSPPWPGSITTVRTAGSAAGRGAGRGAAASGAARSLGARGGPLISSTRRAGCSIAFSLWKRGPSVTAKTFSAPPRNCTDSTMPPASRVGGSETSTRSRATATVTRPDSAAAEGTVSCFENRRAPLNEGHLTLGIETGPMTRRLGDAPPTGL